MNKPPDETLKQGQNRSWLLVYFTVMHLNTDQGRRNVSKSGEAQVFQAYSFRRF
jgi:hypothetical protein